MENYQPLFVTASIFVFAAENEEAKADIPFRRTRIDKTRVI